MQILHNLIFLTRIKKKYFQVEKNIENKKFSVFKFDVHRWKPQTILNEMVVYELTSFTDWLVASFFLSFFTFLLCARLPTTTFKKHSSRVSNILATHFVHLINVQQRCVDGPLIWVICAVDVFSISRHHPYCDRFFGFGFPHSNNAKAKQFISQVKRKQICDFFSTWRRTTGGVGD